MAVHLIVCWDEFCGHAASWPKGRKEEVILMAQAARKLLQSDQHGARFLRCGVVYLADDADRKGRCRTREVCDLLFQLIVINLKLLSLPPPYLPAITVSDNHIHRHQIRSRRNSFILSPFLRMCDAN